MSVKYETFEQNLSDGRGTLIFDARVPKKPCSVCAHADVALIEAELRRKTPLRKIEKIFPHVTRQSLSRHSRHTTPAGGERVTQAMPDAPEQPEPPEIQAATVELSALRQSTADEITLLMRAKSGAARLQQIAVTAQKANALGIAVQALSKYREFLEFIGRLTGELQPAGAVAIGVNVNIRQAWEGCDPKVLRWALARHVREMLTYEPDVVQNLKLLSAGPCPECKRYGCAHDHI